MIDAQVEEEAEPLLFASSAGEMLRHARERKNLKMADVAEATRISTRQLQLMEAGEFAKLPGRTYVVGFARSYARLVGLDEELVIAKIREELATSVPDQDYRNSGSFEPGDPARVPPAKVAWITAIVALLLLAGGYFAYRKFIAPAGEYPSLLAAAPDAQTALAPPPESVPAQAAALPSGPVVFTALEDAVWVKFYDAQGIQLMQKQMALGERYVLPADAVGPQIWTGRPDALGITIGGRTVPRLSDTERLIKDVPISAEALLGRGDPAPAPALSLTPAPVQTAPRNPPAALRRISNARAPGLAPAQPPAQTSAQSPARTSPAPEDLETAAQVMPVPGESPTD